MGPAPEQEFAQFYDATWPRTLACTYAMTGEIGVAEELAQEAYTRAWARWSQIARYDEPGAWVRQVATRLAVSRWRRSRAARSWQQRHRHVIEVDGPSETSALLVTALRQLPEAQRRAIVLHHLADFPVEEVARLEKCPSGTVKARLSRGRAALGEILADPSQNGAPTHA